MEKEINNELIQELNKIWHYFMFNFRKKGNELWGGEFEDVNTIEIIILNIVDNNPDVILKEIKEILNIPGSTLTNAINRLEKKDLIKRIISTRDRRSYGLELTDKGYNVQERHIKIENKLYSCILGALDSNDERRLFLDFLKKIKKNL